MAELFLVPNILSDGDWQNVLPARIFSVLTNTRFFIVENIRTTRRFLKQVNHEIDINQLVFFELNKHTRQQDLPDFLAPLEQGNNVAVISEAGCPGVADPGASVVQIAHQKGYKIVPLVGPSSIVLALMASGLNGQNFAFNGYLPVKPHERTKAISSLEKLTKNNGQTQIFIETPYRNNQLVTDLLKACAPATLLCIAANITGENEFIATKTISQWKGKVPDLHKQPAIFLIGS
ncbi:16S rRNA (cytidine1402-2'-O)-methyltransferase [Mariniphaga anaerophila]|uniref:16S rRNA (Cytidine1402-2'-O)-methyltransferase n=1 Tax=Mariniphaga anaerophila TaxID=1484053 RepID=A0A1M4T1V2_9BACT|nr:SAM-dependent methyltransferase [Mariniphaga anaerophila]SHE38449.1 16S rRNA (cytidine1402-2'-O)-methyltransferase [Mariniphaga anaerophila]